MDEYDDSKYICAANEYDENYKQSNREYIDEIHKAYDLFLQVECNAFQQKKRLGMSGDFHYFNAGVMIMNLKKWREDHLFENLFDYIVKHDFLNAADQDALNAVLNGDFGVLSPKWNSHVLICGITTNYSDEELLEAHRNPLIIHYTGGGKTWNYMCANPYQNLYWKYRKLTPWPNKKNSDRTLLNVCRKQMYFLLKK